MPKKSVKLPGVRGATPRGRDFLDSRHSADVSDLSTAIPLSSSLAGTSRSPLEAEVSASLLASRDDWNVQSAEEIIAEVKRCVQARKPWREEVDEAEMMEKRNRERQEGIDGSFQIILPDNGVRSMEDQLSRRLRAQLLGEEDLGSDALAASFQAPKQEEGKGKAGGRKNLRTPWYLHPKVWFSGEMGKDPSEEDSKGFPYDTLILGEGAAKKKTEDALDKMIKESAFVEAYKQHMQGSRLPHFLQ
eukprot:TRINITY_DN23542_c0_g2_i1.p1 TRINITY_DN23542_c0_g2~~TRINITY_DN23542_c0_g2_i1.p1  ORF type:complete len:246 (+),score=48.61 TRINITY_DN23542_c0_g2_i1:59-796(+)